VHEKPTETIVRAGKKEPATFEKAVGGHVLVRQLPAGGRHVGNETARRTRVTESDPEQVLSRVLDHLRHRAWLEPFRPKEQLQPRKEVDVRDEHEYPALSTRERQCFVVASLEPFFVRHVPIPKRRKVDRPHETAHIGVILHQFGDDLFHSPEELRGELNPYPKNDGMTQMCLGRHFPLTTRFTPCFPPHLGS